MNRTVEELLAERNIEIFGRVVRTPETTIAVGDTWQLSTFTWDGPYRSHYVDGPNAIAVAVLIAAAWLLVGNGIPGDKPWLVPIAGATIIGALWSIGRWLLNWRRAGQPAPETAKFNLSLGIGNEYPTTILSSDEEREIKLLRQRLEATLLPNAVNGE